VVLIYRSPLYCVILTGIDQLLQEKYITSNNNVKKFLAIFVLNFFWQPGYGQILSDQLNILSITV